MVTTNPLKKGVYQSTPDYSKYQSKPITPISTPYTSTPDKIGQTKTEQVRKKSSGGSKSYTDTSIQSIPGQSTGGVLESAKGNVPVSAPISKGNVLKPTKSSVVSAVSYTGEPPARYQQSLWSGTKQFAKNINPFSSQNTYGLIGQQGEGGIYNTLKVYGRKTFLEPFEYVGGTKAEKKIGYNINPQWRGTTFGTISTPSMYEDTTDKTYFQLTDTKKRELFTSAGVSYAGEPVTILPTRIAENVDRSGAIREKYQSQVGEFTTEKDLIKLNEAYNLELQTAYNKKVSQFTPQIISLSRTSKDIFTPTSEKFIKGAGRTAETVGIVGATAFGGSGVTIAATAYLGARTFESTVDYVGNYNKFTTSQKIIGGGGLVLGAAATGYGLKVGTTKFYNEWLNIRYADLGAATSRTFGKELSKTNEFSKFRTTTIQTTSEGKAVTSQYVTAYNTGTNRVGFSGVGVTGTKVYNPATQQFVYKANRFSIGGNVPDINPSGAVRGIQGGKSVGFEGVTTGIGDVIYTGKSQVKYQFLGATKDVGINYNIIGGSKPSPVSTEFGQGVTITSLSSRGRYSGTSVIKKYTGDIKTPTPIDTPISIDLRGVDLRSTATQYTGIIQVESQASKFGSAIATETGKQNIKLSIMEQSTSKGFVTRTGGRGGQVSLPKLKTSTSNVVALGVAQVTSQSTKQYGRLATSLRSISVSAPGLKSYSTSRSITGQIPILGQPTITTQRSSSVSIGRTIPTNQTPIIGIPGGGITPGFALPFMGGGGSRIGSRVVKGGKRKTGYLPSFSAFIFKQTGTYKKGKLASSGLDYRPITSGFRVAKQGAIRLKI